LKEGLPGRNIWATTKQGSTFPLGHTAPDPELSLAVQGIGQAIDPYRTSHANTLRLVLSSTDDEQRFRIYIATRAARSPFWIAGAPRQFRHS
jgi:hypothetical protein